MSSKNLKPLVQKYLEGNDFELLQIPVTEAITDWLKFYADEWEVSEGVAASYILCLRLAEVEQLRNDLRDQMKN